MASDDADGVDRIREQWARERPDLDTEAMGLFGRVYRLSRISGDAVEAAYARHGVGRGEFDVLATLRRAGEPYRLAPSVLTASLMITSGGITGRVDRLERAGLVRRSPDPRDRRSVLVELTDAGRAVVDAAVADGLAVQQRLVAALPARRRRELDALLREMLAATEAAAADTAAAPTGDPAADPADAHARRGPAARR